MTGLSPEEYKAGIAEVLEICRGWGFSAPECALALGCRDPRVTEMTLPALCRFVQALPHSNNTEYRILVIREIKAWIGKLLIGKDAERQGQWMVEVTDHGKSLKMSILSESRDDLGRVLAFFRKVTAQ